MKKIYIIVFVFFNITLAFSQIKSNEKLVYAASYNMSGLMTQLAQVTMNVETVKTTKKTFLHLSLEAETFSKWDAFFKIRDRYESYVDPVTLKSNMYKRSIYEGGYTKTEKYIFSPDGRTINSTSKKRNKPETKKNVSIGSSTQDIISMIYKLRTFNFSKFKPGQTISFMVVFDEKEYPVYVKYMGLEAVSAGNIGKKECLKFQLRRRLIN